MTDHQRSDVELVLEPCDVFLTRGQSFISRAIRRFTRSIGESRTKVNHVGIVVEQGTVHSSWVVEALTTVKRNRLGRYASSKRTEVAVFRPVNLSDEERDLIVEKANSYVGRKYGWFKVAAHLADWCLAGAYVFRRLAKSDNYPICSWVVAYAFLEAGKDFEVDPGAASPDDIWDFVSDPENADKYQQLRGLAPIEPSSSAMRHIGSTTA